MVACLWLSVRRFYRYPATDEVTDGRFQARCDGVL